MEIKAIKNSRKNIYPTIDYFVQNPELLNSSIPKRWLINKFTSLSLASFVLFSSCNNNQKSKDKLLNFAAYLNDNNDNKNVNKTDKKEFAVAPIFSHGNGIGGFGCVAISPPVFLDEGEAWELIYLALKKENIIINRLHYPKFKLNIDSISNGCGKSDGYEVDVKIDGYCKEYNLAVEFASKNDFENINKNEVNCSSVYAISPIAYAKLIRENLKKVQNINAVVFYDPVTYVDDSNTIYENKNYKAIENLAVEDNKKLLLEQVSDFIEWFKTNIKDSK